MSCCPHPYCRTTYKGDPVRRGAFRGLVVHYSADTGFPISSCIVLSNYDLSFLSWRTYRQGRWHSVTLNDINPDEMKESRGKLQVTITRYHTEIPILSCTFLPFHYYDPFQKNQRKPTFLLSIPFHTFPYNNLNPMRIPLVFHWLNEKAQRSWTVKLNERYDKFW